MVSLIRLLLWLYPAPFRARFGEEMVATYLDQRDALLTAHPSGVSRWLALLRLGAHSLWGVVRAALKMRLEAESAQRQKAADSMAQGRASMLDAFSTDIRYGLRTLAKNPGFLVVTVFTLALGIGANTAVFSVLNSVILRPLPYNEPDRLVRIYNRPNESPELRHYLTGPDITELRESVTAFGSVGVTYTYRETGMDLTSDGVPQRIRVLPVSSGWFETYRATPLMGRTFARDEERDDARLVVLSHQLWTEQAGADPAILGQTMVLSGVAYEVIGVMRPGFLDVVGGDVDAWIPLDMDVAANNNRGNHYLSAIARLGPGATQGQAEAQVRAQEARWLEEYPTQYDTRTVALHPLHADVVGDTNRMLLVLMAAAGLVLLIACVNVANLVLARSVARGRETAIRSALGARRRRVAGQQLFESLTIALAGGVIGTVIAYWGVKVLLAVSPQSLARAEEVGFDPWLLAFAVGITGLTAVLFGAVPAVRAAAVDPNEAMRDGTRGNTGGMGRRRVRSTLVTAQVALALVLLVGAGILIRSFVALQRVDLGFDSESVMTFEVHLPLARYAEAEQRVQLHDAYLARLQALPGVEAVGASSWLPGNGDYHWWGYGYLNTQGELTWTGAQVRIVDGDYFDAVGIQHLAGRTFNSGDRLDTDLVALISEGLAREVYGDGDPLGERFRTGGNVFTVAGVVSDVSHDARGTTMGGVYISHQQFAADRNWAMTYTVKTSVPPEAILDRARHELGRLDDALVLFRPRTMDAVLGGHRARDRFTLLLMAVFAVIAVSLAAIGVYGVLSYAVNQRSQEIGIRVALGARTGQVRVIVVRHAALVAGAGLAIGLVAAWWLSRFLQTLVFGVSVRDPLVFIGVAIVLAGVTLLAGYLPARRASNTDPLDALRRGT